MCGCLGLFPHGRSSPGCGRCSRLSRSAGWPVPAAQPGAPGAGGCQALPAAAGRCPAPLCSAGGWRSPFAKGPRRLRVGCWGGFPADAIPSGRGAVSVSAQPPLPDLTPLISTDPSLMRCEAIDTPAALQVAAGRQGMRGRRLTLLSPAAGPRCPWGSGVPARVPQVTCCLGTDGWLLNHTCPSHRTSRGAPCLSPERTPGLWGFVAPGQPCVPWAGSA